jgi:uncharacterized Fe-S radical SAM superfamily protein PflX
MFQYRPLFHAHSYPEIARRPTKEEFEHAVNLAKGLGLQEGL